MHEEEKQEAGAPDVSHRQLVKFLNSNTDKHAAPLQSGIESRLKDREARLGKYVLLSEIGRGGSSTVYKAYDTTLKRFVAIKQLTNLSGGNIDRFLREAEIIAALKHPNIIPIHEINSSNEKPFIVMDYIEGATLDKLIDSAGIRKCVEMTIKVCDALEAAHNEGIIHRDIKPQNIMVENNGRVYVLDFGLAKDIDYDMTLTREIMGTPEFMSPEQVSKKEIDHRTDIYSLGATLYNIATKQVPHSGDSLTEIMMNIVEKDPIPPSKLNRDLSRDLETIIRKCMYKDPSLRYKHIGELKNDLKSWLDGNTIGARPASPAYMVVNLIKRRKKTAILAIVISLFVISSSLLIYKKAKMSGEITGRSGLVANRANAVTHFDAGNEIFQRIAHSTDDDTRENFSFYAEEAIAEFTQATAIDPTYAEAYLRIGEVCLLTNRLRQAIVNLSKAIEQNGNLTEARYKRIIATCIEFNQRLGSVHKVNNKEANPLETAKEDLELLKSTSLRISKILCAEAFIKLTEMLSEGMPANLTVLAAQLTNAIEENPLLADAYQIRGSLKLMAASSENDPGIKTRLLRSALEDFKKVIEISPNNSSCYADSAFVYSALGENEHALKHVAIARKLLPANPELVLVEAKILLASGQREAAIASVAEAERLASFLENETERINYRIEIGALKWRLGMRRESERDFETALNLAPAGMKDAVKTKINQLTSQTIPTVEK